MAGAVAPFTFVEQMLHYLDRPHVGLPESPVTGPPAWRGEDLAASDEWIVDLDPRQVAELDEALAVATAQGVDTRDLSAADFPLPTLAADIDAWRHHLITGRGFLLVRGFPVDRWSPEQVEVAYWCLGLHLGRPGEQSGEGDLLGHVTDRGTDAADVGRQYRTNHDIRFHCDAADVVGLLCLRPARSGGSSRLVSSVTVANVLREEHPELFPRLFEPFLLDTRQEEGSDLPYLPVQPACFDGEVLRTFMHCGYFESVTRHGVELTDLERATLAAWEEIAERPDIRLDMEFGPGDLQLLSNHTITHARTAYVDHDDPARKRHLLRLWLSV